MTKNLRTTCIIIIACRFCLQPLATRAADSPAATPPPGAAKQARLPAPTRSPTAPGTPKLIVVGAKAGQDTAMHAAPGMNPPPDADGDFLIGPEYVRAAEMNPMDGVPKGRVERF